jgi:beta-lactamase class C
MSDDGQPARAGAAAFDAQTYSVKSSSADMIRYVQLQLAPARLPEPLRRALECTQLGHFQVGDMIQGLGWEQYRAPVTTAQLVAGNSSKMTHEYNTATQLTPPQVAPSGTLFNKTGSTRGFSTYVAFVPAQEIGVVLLANRSISSEARIAAAHAILQQLAHAR